MLLILQGPLRAAQEEQEEHDAVIEAATKTVERFFALKQMLGIKNLLGASKGLVIVPAFGTGAFFVAIESGSGVFITRRGETWGDPVFIKLSQKSIGLYFGVKESELIMLVLTRRAIDQFMEGQSQTAGSGGIALGEWGAGASTGGGIKGGMESVTVTLSEGLAIGGGLGSAEL
jgi:lipid-binding SYLF domain-containing protein